MTNYIVSKTLSQHDFRNYTVRSSLSELVKEASKSEEGLLSIGAIILCDPADNTFDLTIQLKDLCDNGVDNYIYINEDPDNTISLILNGISNTKNVMIIDSDCDMYLSDEEELDALLEEVTSSNDSGNALALQNSVSQVQAYIQAYMDNDKVVDTPVFKRQVSSAMNALSTVCSRNEHKLATMGTSSLDLLKDAIETITALEDANVQLEEQTRNLISEHKTQPKANRSGLMFYPPYNYNKLGKVLVVREFSHTPYLLTFLLAYVQYLHYGQNKRVKLVITHGNDSTVGARYENISINGTTSTKVTKSTMSIERLYDNEIVVTDHPHSETFKKLIQDNMDLTIILDKMHGKDPIVKGKVTTIYAINSKHDLDIFDIKTLNNVLTTVSNHGLSSEAILGTVGTIRDFSNMDEAIKISAYTDAFSKIFKKIDALVGLEE